VIYLAFMADSLSYWFVDDSLAFTISETGWVQVALFRVFVFSLVAAVFSAICYFVNNYLLKKKWGIGGTQKAFTISLVIFFSILIPSVIGGVRFALEKPWF